jgi:hypothetical protein
MSYEADEFLPTDLVSLEDLENIPLVEEEGLNWEHESVGTVQPISVKSHESRKRKTMQVDVDSMDLHKMYKGNKSGTVTLQLITPEEMSQKCQNAITEVDKIIQRRQEAEEKAERDETIRVYRANLSERMRDTRAHRWMRSDKEKV